MIGGLLCGGGGGGAGADGAPANRNRIINGNFAVNQRAVSGTVSLSAGEYGHDRWKAGSSGCTYTFATSENITTITITAGSLIQVVEGINLRSGGHVLSWTGTIQMTINGGSAGDSGMTGTLTGGTNAEVETSGTGTITDVQLEEGSVVTPYEFRSYAAGIRMCRRYYWRIATDGTNYLEWTAVVYSGATDRYYFDIVLPEEMRAAPAVSYLGTLSDFTIYVSDATAAPTEFTFHAKHPDRVAVNALCVAAAGGSGDAAMFRCNGAAGAGFEFDAEL